MHEQIPFPLTTKTRPRHGDVSGSEGQYVATLATGELEVVLLGQREAVARLLATFAAVRHRLDGVPLASVGGRAEGEPHDVVTVRVVVPSRYYPGRTG